MDDRNAVKKWLVTKFGLSEPLCLHPDDPDDLSREVLLLDMLLNCYHFLENAAIRGQAYEDFLTFYWDLIMDTAAKGLPVSDAIVVMKQKVNTLCTTSYSEDFLKAAMDFLCSSLIQHYSLFVFSLCHAREEDTKYTCVEVETLTEDCVPPALVTGTEYSAWKLQEDIKELEVRAQREEEIITGKANDAKNSLEAELTNHVARLVHTGKKPDKEQIVEAVKELVRLHSELAAVDIKAALERSKQAVDFEIAKSLIAKPVNKNLAVEHSPKASSGRKTATRRK